MQLRLGHCVSKREAGLRAYLAHAPVLFASVPLSNWSKSLAANLDEKWMQHAIDLAKTKGTDPSNTPIAAVIVLNGKVLAAEVNQTAETGDATAHAEIMAFRAAGKNHRNIDLKGATLYSTLQPCGMCTMGSIWAKIGRIVYGAGREDVNALYFEGRQLNAVDFITDAWREDLELVGGVLREDCAALYYGPDDLIPEN